jgi:flagellar biosynthesis/type III secretory pathway protein FliH
LEQLAMESPILKQAMQALSVLSEDDKARIRAEQREMALISNELDLTAAREQGLSQGRAEGRAEGKAEGRAEGKAEGLLEGRRETLRQLLAARFGELSEGAERRLAEADHAELGHWTARVLVAETLEDVFRE